MAEEHTLEVYTTQIGQWRKVRDMGLTLFDTTIKSGHKNVRPTWEIVLGSKGGTITPQQYTDKYLAILDKSLKCNHDWWIDLLHQQKLVLGCYCKPNMFCHRHLLKAVIKTQCELQGIVFIDKGEIQ